MSNKINRQMAKKQKEIEHLKRKSKHKDSKAMDLSTTIVIIVLALLFLAGIFAIVFSNKPGDEKQNLAESASGSATQAASQENKVVDEKYITRYTQIISNDTKDNKGGSIFYLELNENDGSYKHFLKAGDEKNELNHGTFKKIENGIETTNKDGIINTYKNHNGYLISEKSFYDKKIPNKKTFDLTLLNETKDVSKITIKFKKNGKFSQNITRYSAGLDGKDTANVAKGTYYRKKNFIYRKRDDNTDLMPLLIYDNKLCTSYYKLEKKGSAN